MKHMKRLFKYFSSAIIVVITVLLCGCSAEANLLKAELKAADEINFAADDNVDNYYIDNHDGGNVYINGGNTTVIDGGTTVIDQHDFVQQICERSITEDDLTDAFNAYGGSYELIRYIRNYPYAMHGYIFESKDLTAFFSGYEEYSPNYSDQTTVRDSFSHLEKKNVDVVVDWEEKHGSPYTKK